MGVGCDVGAGVTLLKLEAVATVGAREVATKSAELEALVGSGTVLNGGFEFTTGEKEGSTESTVGKADGICDGVGSGEGLGEGDGGGFGDGAGAGAGVGAGNGVEVASNAGGGAVVPINGVAATAGIAFCALVEIHPRLSSYHSLLQLHLPPELWTRRLSWDCLHHRHPQRNHYRY